MTLRVSLSLGPVGAVCSGQDVPAPAGCWGDLSARPCRRGTPRLSQGWCPARSAALRTCSPAKWFVQQQCPRSYVGLWLCWLSWVLPGQGRRGLPSQDGLPLLRSPRCRQEKAARCSGTLINSQTALPCICSADGLMNRGTMLNVTKSPKSQSRGRAAPSPGKPGRSAGC